MSEDSYILITYGKTDQILGDLHLAVEKIPFYLRQSRKLLHKKATTAIP